MTPRHSSFRVLVRSIKSAAKLCWALPVHRASLGRLAWFHALFLWTENTRQLHFLPDSFVYLCNAVTSACREACRWLLHPTGSPLSPLLPPCRRGCWHQQQRRTTQQLPSYQSCLNQPVSGKPNMVLPGFLTHSVLQSSRWCLLIKCELGLQPLHKASRYYSHRNTSLWVYTIAIYS